MTVSAVARLIPRPPALVDSRKTNWGAPGARAGKIPFIMTLRNGVYTKQERTNVQATSVT